jgi:hypothetical protein
MIGRFAGAGILAFVITTPAIGLATAGTAYDGTWSLTIVTQRGGCDPSYSFSGVQISNGIVSHPNLVKFRGRVSSGGSVHVTVTVGEKHASGSGRLTRTSGSGRWTGRSGQDRCSGYWTATRG